MLDAVTLRSPAFSGWSAARCIARAMLLGLVIAAPAAAAGGPEPLRNWQEVIRQAPYWESQGMHANLVTIRRWVLAGNSFCSDANRHILFDRRATFLGYLTTDRDPEANQAKINERRRQLATAGRVHAWAAGELGGIGYPFALSCLQPDARLEETLARYVGDDPAARLWGTWDGMRVGEPDATVSLHVAIRRVYEDRRRQGRVDLPEQLLATLAGKVIIESGGQREALSPAGARGIMQLSPAVLQDCELGARFQYHRLAQIDCALRLLQQNHRSLEPAFAARFGHLPPTKADALYAMLHLQAYHGGVGRVQTLLGEEALGAPARYFAAHHERFTAGDIALGIILHNLGRDRFGFASLYYVTDISIATAAACARLDDLPGCGGSD